MRKIKFFIVFLVTLVLFLILNRSVVLGIGIGKCGCKFYLESGCKEDITHNSCPELQKCDCQPAGSMAPIVCIGTCVPDPNDPHCNPGTGTKADGIRTAIGCIPLNNTQAFIGWVLPKVIGVASGIAFLLMAFGAFQVITSAGDPKKAQAGKELITSALSGLLFIILSIFLLKLIGVDILRIPGFGK